MNRIDINCDLGEHFGRWTLGDDAAILPYISSANIACGFHAGDPLHIQGTIQACLKHGVSIGAHPSFPDLQGFGRRRMHLSSEEIHAVVLYQVAALKGMAEAAGARLKHVKPHGALYNMAAADIKVAEPIARAIADLDKGLKLMGPPDSSLAVAAETIGLGFIREGFMDRAYNLDGQLLDRHLPGAVHHQKEKVVQQALTTILDRKVRTLDGSLIRMEVDSLCLHGDTPGAAELAKDLFWTLKDRGIHVAAD